MDSSEHSVLSDVSSSTTDTSETEWRSRVTNTDHKDIGKLMDNALLSELSVQAMLGHTQQVATLLARGCNPNARDRDGDRTPLHWAAARNHLKVVSVLLAADADPSMPDQSGLTASQLARRFGHDGVAMRLECGAPLPDPKQVYEGMDGCSLMAALNHPKRLRYVLKSASPNVRDSDGDRTPLHWAAARGHVTCIQHLIRYGASVNAVDATGRTPGDLALELRQGEACARLAHAPWVARRHQQPAGEL